MCQEQKKATFQGVNKHGQTSVEVMLVHMEQRRAFRLMQSSLLFRPDDEYPWHEARDASLMNVIHPRSPGLKAIHDVLEVQGKRSFLH